MPCTLVVQSLSTPGRILKRDLVEQRADSDDSCLPPAYWPMPNRRVFPANPRMTEFTHPTGLAHERVERDRLQRHRPPARFRLRALQSTPCEGAADVNDA